jgi:nicotinate-nucleotide adenylyltransferase
MKKVPVAILGGSFDPPTHSHMSICAEVIKNLAFIREFWFIPCGSRTDKKAATTGEQRLEMTKLARNYVYPECSYIKVSDIEIKHGPLIPTAYLLQKLEKEFPEKEFYFIIGADLIASLSKWDEPEYLYETANIIIFNRIGYELDLSGKSYRIPKKYIYVESTNLGPLSSTETRSLLLTIKRDNTLDLCKLLSLICKSVLEYILMNKLYLTK